MTSSDQQHTLDGFFSKHVAQCIPAEISRNKYVSEQLFITHPELFYAPCFGENPNLSAEYLESKAAELNYDWMSSTPHIAFLLKRPALINWEIAAANCWMPPSVLLEHEEQCGLCICDNPNFDEEYFESRITRGLPVDSNRLCANRAISFKWLVKHNFVNWFWIGYNRNMPVEIFRDNLRDVQFATWAYNTSADFNLIDQYLQHMDNAAEPHHAAAQGTTADVVQAACYNSAVPLWFLDKYREWWFMPGLAQNPGLPRDWLLANVPYGDLSNSPVMDHVWHAEHLDTANWAGICRRCVA